LRRRLAQADGTDAAIQAAERDRLDLVEPAPRAHRRVMGQCPIREHRKTKAALERIRGLEEEVEQLMRELHAVERCPTDEDGIRGLLRG
jgi:hypothetical protein